MKFARIVFLIAGIYGLLVLVPDYFLERTYGQMYPPAITHPELYYGFLGTAVAWQVAFLIISRDPARYRPLMLAAMIEKFSFAAAAAVLYFQQRIASAPLAGACGDTLLGVLFVISYLKTSQRASA